MKRRAPRSLVLKCPTWDHVESFYARKVKEGGELSARVPFQPDPGEIITLALELPDELVMAIDAEVEQSVPASDGKKSAVRLRVVGLTSSVRRQLETLVAQARREREASAGATSSASPAAAPDQRNTVRHKAPDQRNTVRHKAPDQGNTVRHKASDQRNTVRHKAPDQRTTVRHKSSGETIPPPPNPIDAPVDELIEPPVLPSIDDVPAGARPLFESLKAELQRMREASAHEVLGVRWDAGASDIRRAYFELSKRLHPDAFARHRSPAIQQLSREVFIHVNRAYDRMRDAAVASGSAIAAGPDLLPHRGWLAPFEDLGEGAAAQGPLAALHIPSSPPRVLPSATPWPTFSAPSFPLTSDGLFEDIIEEDPAEIDAAAASLLPEASDDVSPPPRPRSESGGRPWRAPTSAGPPRPATEVMAEARDLIASRDWPRAKEILAESLRREPRNRSARALYHLASAEALLAEGKAVDARTQLEVALAHDPTLAEARAAMERTRSESARKAGILRRLFK